MFLSRQLSIALALSLLVTLPVTAASVSIKAKVTGNQNNIAKKISILNLDKGSKDGVKTGAKGSASYLGFTDAKGANQAFKAPMILPFAISKPGTEASDGIAHFPGGLPPIISSGTPATIVSYVPDKPRKIDINQPIPGSAKTKNPPSQKGGNATAQPPKKVAKKPPKKTQPPAQLIPKPPIQTVEPLDFCASQYGGTTTNRQFCLRVDKSDIISQAVLSGELPGEIDPQEGQGISKQSDWVDDRLSAVAQRYGNNPNDPVAQLALGQEYLRFNHYEKASQFLANIQDPGTDDEFSDLLTHSRMYANYAVGNYEQVVQDAANIKNKTYAQSMYNIQAAAYAASGNTTASEQILSGLMSSSEVLNNRAINTHTQDKDHPEAARALFDQALTINPNNLSVVNNLAILDIEQNQFGKAYGHFAAIYDQVAPINNSDPVTLSLKRSTLWYVNNYQINEDYVRQQKIPLDVLQTATGVQAGAMILKTILGGKVTSGDITGLLFGLVGSAIQQQKVNDAITKVRNNFLDNLTMLPTVSGPNQVDLSKRISVTAKSQPTTSRRISDPPTQPITLSDQQPPKQPSAISTAPTQPDTNGRTDVAPLVNIAGFNTNTDDLKRVIGDLPLLVNYAQYPDYGKMQKYIKNIPPKVRTQARRTIADALSGKPVQLNNDLRRILFAFMRFKTYGKF
ncbi:MAG: tetratricopeptide repeat protein [Anaerolineae bacterium]|nr:tetratricopeptide repeat protein [Gloeobacterales cyanobacterium ES-bin-313]